MNILKILFKSIIWICLSLPLLIILGGSYYLSLNNSIFSFKSVDAIIGYLSDKTCSELGTNAVLVNCLFDKNKTLVLFSLIYFFILLLAVLMYRHLITFKVFKYIADNFLFVSLVLPILYYTYIYLPTSWRANNPKGFLILAASVFIHLICIGLLSRIFIKIFKKDLAKE